MISRLLKKLFDTAFFYNYVAGPFYQAILEPVEVPLFRRFLQDLPPIPPGGAILDVGCGPGVLTLLLAETYPDVQVTGVDYAHRMVARAEANLRRKPGLKATFRQGDAHALPFPDRSFDGVMSVGSLKHWRDPVRGLTEIHRVLKPGGVAHVVEAFRDCPQADLETFIRAMGATLIPLSIQVAFVRRTVFGEAPSLAEVRDLVARTPLAGAVVEPLPGTPVFRLDARVA